MRVSSKNLDITNKTNVLVKISKFLERNIPNDTHKTSIYVLDYIVIEPIINVINDNINFEINIGDFYKILLTVFIDKNLNVCLG